MVNLSVARRSGPGRTRGLVLVGHGVERPAANEHGITFVGECPHSPRPAEPGVRLLLELRRRARPIWLTASDGTRLYGIEAGVGRTAVVLAHEGGADLCGWLPYVRTLQAAGLRVLAFDFRGYGSSEVPATATLALGRDLAGAVARVRSDGAADVFLMGASMGGAAVVQNSSGTRVSGRISLSGTRLWQGYGVNDPAGVRRISAPFLCIGSRDDSRAPATEAQSVLRNIGSADKRIVLYPGSTHGWDLVEQPPYGSRTSALILKWIRAHSR